MPKPNPEFAEAVAEALRHHNLTLRGAEYKTGIDHTTVTKMVNGLPPSRGKVIEWAEGLGENINHWLELAGWEPIPPALVEGGISDRVIERAAEYLAEKGLSKEEIEELKRVVSKDND